MHVGALKLPVKPLCSSEARIKNVFFLNVCISKRWLSALAEIVCSRWWNSPLVIRKHSKVNTYRRDLDLSAYQKVLAKYMININTRKFFQQGETILESSKNTGSQPVVLDPFGNLNDPFTGTL